MTRGGRACGAVNAEGSQFCGSCGASLAPTERCTSCGRENPADQRFCNGCGAALEGVAEQPPQAAPGATPTVSASR